MQQVNHQQVCWVINTCSSSRRRRRWKFTALLTSPAGPRGHRRSQPTVSWGNVDTSGTVCSAQRIHVAVLQLVVKCHELQHSLWLQTATHRLLDLRLVLYHYRWLFYGLFQVVNLSFSQIWIHSQPVKSTNLVLQARWNNNGFVLSLSILLIFKCRSKQYMLLLSQSPP